MISCPAPREASHALLTGLKVLDMEQNQVQAATDAQLDLAAPFQAFHEGTRWDCVPPEAG